MNSIKCAIFDKDGTLLDFSSLWIPVADKAIDDICSPYNVSYKIKSRILEGIGVKNGHVSVLGALCYGTYRDIANVICDILDDEKIEYNKEEIIKNTPRAFVNGSDEGELKPTSDDLRDCLVRMKNSGIKIFVVTSDNEEMALICLKRLKIDDLFDEILADDGIHPSKPDPYYVNYLVEKYGFNKSEMCMVGDTPTDMKFAINGGIKGYGVNEDAESKAILNKYATTVSDNISTLVSEGRFGNI